VVSGYLKHAAKTSENELTQLHAAAWALDRRDQHRARTLSDPKIESQVSEHLLNTFSVWMLGAQLHQ
jgi:hypothetical protein